MMKKYTFRTAISGLELSEIGIVVEAENVTEALILWEAKAIEKLTKTGMIRLTPGINSVIQIEARK